MSEWKSKQPNEWSPTDYSRYLYESGIAEYYYNFYNCIDDKTKQSYGFRPPSAHI